MPSPPSYRLVPAGLEPVAAPMLDPSQQAVVDHAGGPLLVLAGPGTGKTTTLVEAVVDRVRRGLAPEQILVLTFSRKAADELRERIAGRLARTLSEPAAYTFHGFCSAVVNAYGDGVPRLLSGPERLVRIRELLAGDAAGEGTTTWPAPLRDCLTTRGFAQEVADLLDRLRERAMTSDDLRALARHERRADWRAAADFFDEYAQVLRGRETDYAELVTEALRLLETDLTVLADVRDRYHAVFVDEYQDTDPAQERMLQLLAGDGRDLVAVGDPDQSIYGFRGADVSCLLEFPDRFRTRGGPAPVLSLTVSRRAGAGLLAVSRAVAGGLPAPGLPAQRLRAHRDLHAAPSAVDGAAGIGIYGTAADEAIAIADLLRRAHLGQLEPDRRLPWSEMAVLVRSGVRSMPVLRRALVAAGVPVVVASDEVPVARDPAVAPMLRALRVVDKPAELTGATVLELLSSPLVGASPAQVRGLGRALRAQARAADALRRAADPDLPPSYPRASPELMAEAVREPELLAGYADRVGSGARRLAALLAAAGDQLSATGSPELALWTLWERSRWPQRLAAAALAGGQEGRAADRDLDAVVALFEAVARFSDARPRAGVGLLLAELEAQEIPSASRVEGRRGQGGVRLLTAHRSKGLEWDLVVVAGVQEGGWPDLRRRGSLLDAQRLGPAGRPPEASAARLVEERRLFYVALTRARRHLFLTAVQSVDDAGPRPSRFLEETRLDVPAPSAAPGQLLSVRSLAGRLRRGAVDFSVSEGSRIAAAAVLGRLAAGGDDGRPLVAAAAPAAWWGMALPTAGAVPVRPVDERVRVTASALAAHDQCPLRWFLEREVHAASAATAAQGFGTVVHALARLVSTGALPDDVDVLVQRLDTVWNALGFEAAWLGPRERDRARAALHRLIRWSRDNDREHLGSEVEFGPVEVAGAVLAGTVDRLDADAEGRLHVVDYKTSGSKPARAKVATDLQLGLYQLAAQAGGMVDAAGGRTEVGGAELVQLVDGLADGRPSVQLQAALPPDGGPVSVAVHRMVDAVLAEQFPARPNDRCEKCAFRRACPAQDAGRQVVS